MTMTPGKSCCHNSRQLFHQHSPRAPSVLTHTPSAYLLLQGGGESGAPLRRTAVTPAAAKVLDLEGALAALALPRELGPHPTDGAPVMAGSGRWV